MLDSATFHVNVFATGLIDFLSIHKTLLLLVNNKDIAWISLQILGANCFLLLGSIFLFNKGLNPALRYIKSSLMPEEISADHVFSDEITWSIYSSFWLLPICALCYGCSIMWYQELADKTFEYLKQVPKKSSTVEKSIGNALYGTLVWFFVFFQVQLLTLLSPFIFNQLACALEVFFLGLTNVELFRVAQPLLSVLQQSILSIVYACSYLIQGIGLFIMCMLYGWYGFDYKWMANGVSPDERFSIMEKHWAYFVGFGFPYMVLLRSCSFFLGYGIFLATFPFSIMLGAMLSYSQPYKKYATAVKVPKQESRKPASKSGTKSTSSSSAARAGQKPSANKHTTLQFSVPVFKVAQQWTIAALKYIDKNAYTNIKRRPASSASDSSSDSKNSKGSKVE